MDLGKNVIQKTVFGCDLQALEDKVDDEEMSKLVKTRQAELRRAKEKMRVNSEKELQNLLTPPASVAKKERCKELVEEGIVLHRELSDLQYAQRNGLTTKRELVREWVTGTDPKLKALGCLLLVGGYVYFELGPEANQTNVVNLKAIVKVDGKLQELNFRTWEQIPTAVADKLSETNRLQRVSLTGLRCDHTTVPNSTTNRMTQCCWIGPLEVFSDDAKGSHKDNYSKGVQPSSDAYDDDKFTKRQLCLKHGGFVYDFADGSPPCVIPIASAALSSVDSHLFQAYRYAKKAQSKWANLPVEEAMPTQSKSEKRVELPVCCHMLCATNCDIGQHRLGRCTAWKLIRTAGVTTYHRAYPKRACAL